MTLLNKTTLVALVAALGMASTPAFASTSQEDVQSCRAAMTDRGTINMDAYRLRFESAKGNNQGRTLYLKAIPNTKNETAFRFTCELNKNKVIALNTSNVIRFAKR